MLLQSQKCSIPQNAANTAPLVPPELLALQSVGAAIRVNTDYTGDEPVVLLCMNCKMCRQKTNLACCCAIHNKIYRNGVLLSPLVRIDHILPVEHHLCANPYLDSTGIMVHAPAVLAARPRPNNINEHVNQPRNIGLMFRHTRHANQWSCNSSVPPPCFLLQLMHLFPDIRYNEVFKAKIHMQFNKWLMAQNPNEAIHGATHHELSK